MPRPGNAGRKRKAKPAAASYRKSPPAAHSSAFSFRAPGLPWLVLGLVTAIAWLNAVHDAFVYDDQEFLAEGRFAGLGLSDLAGLFSQSLWEASGNTVSLYRPLLTVSFGLQSKLFGDWAAGYHLVNVALHVVATLLVFGLVREVLRSLGNGRDRSNWAALMASLVFGVHPVHSEVVNSVFNGSEIYVTILLAGGLWYLLVQVSLRPVRAWLMLSVLYLCALLFRENAVSLPALAVVVLWMTGEAEWKSRFRRCLPAVVLLLPLAAYLALRAHALEIRDQPAGGSRPVPALTAPGPELRVGLPGQPLAAAMASNVSEPRPATPVKPLVGDVSVDLARLGGAVSMWFDGLKLMVWPHPLLVTRDGSTTPLALALGVQLGLWLLVLYALYRKRPAPAIGLGFFYIAILPSSRIVSADIPVPVLTERMLYLSSVGLVMCLAAGMIALADRWSIRIASATAAAVVMVLMPVTWARNSDWSNEVALLERDFTFLPDNHQLLVSLVNAHERAGNHARAVELCGRHAAVARVSAVIGRECAKSYTAAGLLARAEALFDDLLAQNPADAWTRFELARLLVERGRRDEARAQFDAALAQEKLPFLREFMSAIMLIDLYPDDRDHLLEARDHVRNALRLQPREHQARQLLEYLDQRL